MRLSSCQMQKKIFETDFTQIGEVVFSIRTGAAGLSHDRDITRKLIKIVVFKRCEYIMHRSVVFIFK
ncbi:hypothetical protein M514_00939 [Trichuris suis]|uniref:Uncharacterized protein n=1 Tax=Trichuris suis TaxID=68888 RepID=A0A085MWD3_9BILA|nr:hypothetical protein M513_00939 [Trichuris suis]KFD61529.1 hypothetical protein M514_00939 [Trichuris suis]